MHPLERAFLDDIIENPDDDVPRLVYADWLTDQGRGDRAEFIRVQVAAAVTGQIDCGRKKKPGPGPANWLPIRCGLCDFCRPDRRAFELHRDVNIDTLIGPTAFSFAHTTAHHSLDDDPAGGHVTLYLWRGFVETVRCPLQFWLDHGRDIVQAHPVRRVEATDKRPGFPAMLPHGDKRRGWYSLAAFDDDDHPEEADELPEEVWTLITDGQWPDSWWKFFADEREADAALSNALILFARKPLESPATPTLTY
jgi:uncharacterized protein (TIGR02996 family)